MLINFKKLHPNAVKPEYAKPGDAGMDLTAVSVEYADQYIEYNTGIAVEIPDGYCGLIFPRSSNSKMDLQLCNSVGVIDSTYRGPIKLRFRRIMNPMTNKVQIYQVGDRVGQLMILPYPKVLFHQVDELSSTERGSGGFGSTGK